MQMVQLVNSVNCIDSWSNIVAYLNDMCTVHIQVHAIGYRAHRVVCAQIASSLKSDQRCYTSSFVRLTCCRMPARCNLSVSQLITRKNSKENWRWSHHQCIFVWWCKQTREKRQNNYERSSITEFKDCVL